MKGATIAKASLGIGLLVARLTLAGQDTGETSPMLAALTEEGTLITFPAEHPGEARTMKPSGVSGRLIGLDRRPANGLLYGLTAAGDVYTIDPVSAAGKLVSTLTLPFNGGSRSGVDFNPRTDRLRLVGPDGQNLRVNVDNGATAMDRTLAYAREDPHFGRPPAIAGVAYTNNVAGAQTTEMFDLDSGLDLLVRQDPPNDGILRTVGSLGVHVPPEAGFEIVTDGAGRNRGFAAFASTLYAIDLATGAATSLGTIGGPSGSIVGLSVIAGSP